MPAVGESWKQGSGRESLFRQPFGSLLSNRTGVELCKKSFSFLILFVKFLPFIWLFVRLQCLTKETSVTSDGCLALPQLILATIPENGQSSAPYIVNNRNLLLLFDIQKKVHLVSLWCLSLPRAMSVIGISSPCFRIEFKAEHQNLFHSISSCAVTF